MSVAETIDLLEPFRSVEGMEIEGSLTVTIDHGAIGEHVGEAIAALLSEGLRNGNAPDGTSLPGVKPDTERRRGPGSRGHRTGALADSYSVQKTDTGAAIVTEYPERAAAVFRGVPVMTDALMKTDGVDGALTQALEACFEDG